MRLNLRIASRSGLSLLTVGGRERDGFVERFMFLAFKNEQASERTFPRERESRAGWKRWKQRSKKLIHFFLFFFLNKKRKTLPPLPPSAAFLLSFSRGVRFLAVLGWCRTGYLQLSRCCGYCTWQTHVALHIRIRQTAAATNLCWPRECFSKVAVKRCTRAASNVDRQGNGQHWI